MIIKSIELTNIRSYKHQQIDFNSGINFISGDIGSGKSSILQAVEFALFGFKKGDLEAYQLLRKGEKKASIKLVIETANNKTIEICRNLRQSKSDIISQINGHILRDDNLIELSPQELNAYVFNVLNFPKEFLTKDKNLIYRFTIYTPQEQLKEILFTENEKRLEIVRKIFGIDKYKLIQTAVDIYSKKIREDKKVFNAKLEPLEKIKKELEELNKSVIENDKKVVFYQGKEKDFLEKQNKVQFGILKRDEVLSKLNNKLIEYEKEKSKIESSEDLLEKLIVKKDGINVFFKTNDKLKEEEKIKKLEIELKLLDDKIKNLIEDKQVQEKGQKKKNELELQREEVKNNILSYNSKQESYINLKNSFDYVLTQCQVKDLENYIKKQEKEIKKLEKEEVKLNKFEEEKVDCKNKINILNEDILRIEKKKDDIVNLHKCENCMQEVNSEHKKNIKKNIDKEIKDKRVVIDDLQKKLEDIIKKIELSCDVIKKFENVKLDIVRKKERLKLLLEKEENEKELNTKLKLLRSEVDKYDIKKLNSDLKILEDKLLDFKKIQDKLNELNKDEIEFNKQINDIKLKIQKSKTNIDMILQKEKELVEIEKEVKSLEKVFKSKEQLNIKFSKYKENNDKYVDQKSKLEESNKKLDSNLKIISNKIAEINKEIRMIKSQIEVKNIEIKNLEKVQLKLEKVVKDEFFLTNKLVNISTQIEKQIFTKYYIEFNEIFVDIFKDLIEDSEIDIRLNLDFLPVIEQNGYDTDVKNLSGGEKASLSIAYRLGLKQVIENNLGSSQKLSLLILDEPTDGLSEEQMQRFGNMLKTINTSQIIVVSHDEKMESIADNILRIEKINHTSGVIRESI